MNGKKETYNYDNAGNCTENNGVRIEYWKNKNGGNSQLVKFDGSWYFIYDENGNRTYKAKALVNQDSPFGGEAAVDKTKEYWKYDWNVFGQMIKVEQMCDEDGDGLVCVDYEYDGLNHRIVRGSRLEGTKTNYLFGRNGAVVSEKCAKNGGYALRDFYYLNDQVILFKDYVENSFERLCYPVTDIQGSVYEIYSSEGKLLWKMNYGSYGDADGAITDLIGDFSRNQSEALSFNGMYTGSQRDRETSLTYHWNRWQSEDGLTWISPDPARDGWNWWGYCGQNPLTFIDSTGLFYYTENGQKSSSAHKNTQVYIFRSNDGLGNKFDSTRIIMKDGKCLFVDSVGANCSEKYYDGTKNFTKPDGVYYYSFEKLKQNEDGTYDSTRYHNVIRTKTDDENISEEKRNAINNNPGDFLDHANQFKDSSEPYNSNEMPGGAGCDIGKDGQEHQNEYMKTLMDGVDRPEEIRLEIISVNNITTENK